MYQAADFSSCFVVVGLDTKSICASIRLAGRKIITESDGTFIARQALIRINESGRIRTYENLNMTRRK
jgi:hypothetical protein